MPYNGSGLFNLYTPGNPTVSGTAISSSWANNTLSDLATGLSNAVTRDGQTTLNNGTVGAPTLSFGSSGIYAPTSGQIAFSAGGVQALLATSSAITLTGAVTLSSTLGVTGAATLSSTLAVTGAATLSSTLGVTGAATLSSTLGVTGAATLSSTLAVTGAATFSAKALTVPQTVASVAATTIDASTSNVFYVSMTANITTLTIANPTSGQTINIIFKQDATGSRTCSMAAFKWPGAGVPVLSTAANAVDLLVATYHSTAGVWMATLSKDFR